jgi:hypothetical protein
MVLAVGGSLSDRPLGHYRRRLMPATFDAGDRRLPDPVCGRTRRATIPAPLRRDVGDGDSLDGRAARANPEGRRSTSAGHARAVRFVRSSGRSARNSRAFSGALAICRRIDFGGGGERIDAAGHWHVRPPAAQATWGADSAGRALEVRRIELVDHEPATFWSTLNPQAYPFVSNVEPDVPRPWPQSTERMLGTGEQFPTQLFNGYQRYVAGLYRQPG